MSRRQPKNNFDYEALVPSEETIRKRIDTWDEIFKRFNRPETEEELANAIPINELGENVSEDEIYNDDNDESGSDTDFEDSEAELIASKNEPEVKPEQLRKILQPILNQRRRFAETYREKKSEKTIRTKNRIEQTKKSTVEKATFSDKQRTNTNAIDSGASAIAGPAPNSTNTVAEMTPRKKSVRYGGKNKRMEEIEETITTTTVTTTTKKVRRMVERDSSDASKLRAKRKLKMPSNSSDDDEKKIAPKSYRRKSFSTADLKKTRLSAIQAPAVENQMADARKHGKKSRDKPTLQPEEVKQAALEKIPDDSCIESIEPEQHFNAIEVKENECYRTNKDDLDELNRIVQENSEVDILARVCRASISRQVINN